MVVLVLVGCGLGAPADPDAQSESGEAESAQPRFYAATKSLAELIGMPFDAQTVPVELGGANGVTGSVIINAEADPSTDDTVAMHWFVDETSADQTHVNVVLSTLGFASGSDVPQWTPLSAWRLEIEPDMVVTVGTTVCAAPVHTYDWQNGEFIAVVNREQNQAFGAWTLTRNGPVPYAQLASLHCERFIP